MSAVCLEQVPVPKPSRCLQADDLLRSMKLLCSHHQLLTVLIQLSVTADPGPRQASECAESMRPDSYAVPHTAGKTLTVHAVARSCAKEALDTASPPVLLSINCMTLQTPSHVFRRILDGLSASRQTASSVDSFVSPGGPHPCLALDISLPG